MTMLLQSSTGRIPRQIPILLLLLSLHMVVHVHAKVCLMMYQLADNDLEYYIRQDYEELSNSPAVSNTDDLRTWIYYDAYNQGGQELPNTVDTNGNALEGTFTGSRYITYDSTLTQFRVDVELPEEQNSDEPTTVQSFLEHALQNCLADGHDSLMVVFSSHGGGFAGFGGDENTRRQLLQTNQNIATAIRAALDNSAGAGSKLQVLGFDACLMQGLGAADDYLEVTDYILASEAVEPGHGWAYLYLEGASTALELSEQIVTTFLDQTQGGSSHQVPKLLSIVDTNLYLVFIDALEAFAGELLALLEGGDRSLHAFVSRSRASAVAFEGVPDTVGSTNPSALDIGSWMDKFDELCNPSVEGTLGAALQAVRTAYTDMIVFEGVGEGTAAGTGMHLDWPVQSEYTANTPLWNQILFNNANFATQITPNFSAFIEWFLQSGSPEGITSDSVCGQNAESDPDVEIPDQEDGTASLFVTDSGAPDDDTGRFLVSATITLEASEVLVQYGVDLTTPLKELLVDMGYEPGDDYLYLWGGDVVGDYQRNTFSASWDYNFYFLNITGTSSFEALYVKDQGDGSKTIPVLYFPEDSRADVAKLQYLDYLFFDFAYWIEQGAQYGFLKFSVDEAIGRVNDNLGLYVSNKNGALREQPRSSLGLLLPLIEIDAVVQGRTLTTLPGGFNQTVIEWSPSLDYNILTTPIGNIFNVIPNTDAAVVSMTAYNHGNEESKPETKIYTIAAEEAATLAIATKAPTAAPVPTVETPETETPESSPTVSPETESSPTQAPETETSKPSATEAPETEVSKPSATEVPNTETSKPSPTVAPSSSSGAPGFVVTTDAPFPTAVGNGTVVASEEKETTAPHANISSNIFDHGETDELIADDSDQMQDNQTQTPTDMMTTISDVEVGGPDSLIESGDQVGGNQTDPPSSANSWHEKSWRLFLLALFMMWACFY